MEETKLLRTEQSKYKQEDGKKGSTRDLITQGLTGFYS
jgi:hypothetical protein